MPEGNPGEGTCTRDQVVRLDQWLWAVRLYATRSVAVAAIQEGRVSVDGAVPKPAREMQVGQQVQAKTGDITRTYRVLGFPRSRIGAALVPQFAEDLTPPEEFLRRREAAIKMVDARPRGAGRPTKRDRRDLERWRDSEF